MILAVNYTIKGSAIAIHTMALQIRFSLLALLCAAVFITGCSNDEAGEKGAGLHTFSGAIMGTWYTVKYLPPKAVPSEQINAQIHAG